MTRIQRGEVHDVMPGPSVMGREIEKKRPCVVVSSNVVNDCSDLCIVCPITEGVGKEADIIHIAVRQGESGTTKDSIVLCEQIKAVDKDRLVEKRGNIDADTMRKIDKGLKMVLSL